MENFPQAMATQEPTAACQFSWPIAVVVVGSDNFCMSSTANLPSILALETHDMAVLIHGGGHSQHTLHR